MRRCRSASGAPSSRASDRTREQYERRGMIEEQLRERRDAIAEQRLAQVVDGDLIAQQLTIGPREAGDT